MLPHPEVYREALHIKICIRRIVIEDKAGQLDDSGFTVLEKVTSLEDNEEVARLAGEAKGRKGFCCHFLQFYAQSCALHIGV